MLLRTHKIEDQEVMDPDPDPGPASQVDRPSQYIGHVWPPVAVPNVGRCKAASVNSNLAPDERFGKHQFLSSGIGGRAPPSYMSI